MTQVEVKILVPRIIFMVGTYGFSSYYFCLKTHFSQGCCHKRLAEVTIGINNFALT